MNYYKLAAIAAAPYATFSLVAGTTAEYTSGGWDSDPLVLDQDSLPEIQSGVCVKTVSEGAIVDTDINLIIAANTASAQTISDYEIARAEALRKYIQYMDESGDFSVNLAYLEKTVKMSDAGTVVLDGLPDGFWCCLLLTSEATVNFSSPNGSVVGETSIDTINCQVFIQHLGNNVYQIK